METSVLEGCACDGLWAGGGQGESDLDSSVIVGSLSNSSVTTYAGTDADTHFCKRLVLTIKMPNKLWVICIPLQSS